MTLFYLLLLITHLVSSLQLGDDCELSKNEIGSCVNLKYCSKAIEDIKKSIFPKICLYEGLETIVCCPKNISVPLQPENKQIRISKQKCIEYGKSVFKLEKSPLLLGPQSVNISTCAVDVSFIETVFAKPKEYPHMAILGFGPENNKTWLCSGSLISDKYVITVALCTNSRISGHVQWVRLGDLDFNSSRDNSGFEDFGVLKIIRHPSFRYPVRYNDIALLELDRSVRFTEFIRPACIYSGSDYNISRFILSGWEFAQSVDREENKGHLKQFKSVRRVSDENCNETYSQFIGRRLPNGILPETMICSEEPFPDGCLISGGSILQKYNEDVYCMYDIIGIMSFGTSFCRSQPIVYTKISGYVDWIEGIVWPHPIEM